VESRISFIVVISLVCVSLLVTFLFLNRFLKEEYVSINPVPSLPQIPKESVEMAFLYPPEVFRDPFKGPTIPKPKLVATPKIETVEVSAPPSFTSPQYIPPKKIQQKPIIQVVETPPLPRFKITGIIYDESPIAIIEFDGKSNILGKDGEITKGLKIKRIYIDSIDVSWEGKDYNIKLGGN